MNVLAGRLSRNGTAVAVPDRPRLVLSFDVEEHHLIEAAAGMEVGPALQDYYRGRVAGPTHWLLDLLAEHEIKATFFIVGEVARFNPGLIRSIHGAGHEVASHSWEHRRVHTLTASAFRRDVHKSKDTLEQITGEAVVGFRAPTFSIVRHTAWAIDILAELGMLYDSSIYPVWHDRYGIPDAPRDPFRVRGGAHTLLEIPPATWQLFGTSVPVGGGGYFRLFPLWLLQRAWQQRRSSPFATVTMLYFHPWEFDARQARLPLSRVSRFRTYVGVHRSRARLSSFLARQPHDSSLRAVDVAHELALCTLPLFDISKAPAAVVEPSVRVEDQVQPALS